MDHGVTQGIPAATQALEARTSQLTAQGEHVILVFGVFVEFDGQIGPWLNARIDRAAECAWDDTAADVLVSGAAVQNRHVEAHAMATGLVARGIEMRRILIEPFAETTVDNVAFGGFQLRATNRPQLRKLTVVAEPYHAMRALRIAPCWAMMQPGPIIELRLAAAERIGASLEFASMYATIQGEDRHRTPMLARLSVVALNELERLVQENRRVAAAW